mmetsp:Transcript_111334/g.311093  ORF Transcript_111334/g.311093 Transcript_111334/m.311093 type:complete len:413 (-) Transcript_111334:281-1519(-)
MPLDPDAPGLELGLRLHHLGEAHPHERPRRGERHRPARAAPRLREAVRSEGDDVRAGRGPRGGGDRRLRRRGLLEECGRRHAGRTQRVVAGFAGDCSGLGLPSGWAHDLRDGGRRVPRRLYRAVAPSRHVARRADRRRDQPRQQRGPGLRRERLCRRGCLLQGCPWVHRQHRVRHPRRGSPLLLEALRWRGWVHPLALPALPLAQAREPVPPPGPQRPRRHLGHPGHERGPRGRLRAARRGRADEDRRAPHLRRRADPAEGKRAHPAQVLAPEQAHRRADGVHRFSERSRGGQAGRGAARLAPDLPSVAGRGLPPRVLDPRRTGAGPLGPKSLVVVQGVPLRAEGHDQPVEPPVAGRPGRQGAAGPLGDRFRPRVDLRVPAGLACRRDLQRHARHLPAALAGNVACHEGGGR